MKLDTIIIANDEGESNEVPKKDYIKGITKELEVPDYSGEDGNDVPAEKVVDSVIKAVSAEKEVPDDIQDQYSELIARVTEDVNNTKEYMNKKKSEAADEKERKKKEKEEAAKKKAEQEALVKKRQEDFFGALDEGADKAQEDYTRELANIKEALPEGISVNKKGDGFGIDISDKVTDVQLGSAIGYLYQSTENSQFLTNQVQFFIGDLAAAAVTRGLFKTGLEASKTISKNLEEQGKRMSPAAIETYRRMSQRTPVEYRNPKADPTAYLELSKIKRPKKGEKEKQDVYKDRVERFEKDIQGIQEKLAKGEVVSRKDVQPLANEVQYNHGLKERPDPEEESKLSVTDMLRIYFLSDVTLKNLIGIYRDKDNKIVKGQACFMNKENNSKVWVTKEQIEELRASVSSELQNVFMSSKDASIEDYMNGFVKTEVKEAVGTKPDGTAMTEKRQVEKPVYLPVFFQIEEEHEEVAEPEPEKPAAKKDAKKEAANA